MTATIFRAHRQLVSGGFALNDLTNHKRKSQEIKKAGTMFKRGHWSPSNWCEKRTANRRNIMYFVLIKSES